MSNILKGLNENFSRDEENQQNAMDTRRSSDLSRERNVGLNEPDELPTSSAETRNGVYEYNVPEGQEKLAQDLGLQYHKGHWVSRIPFQRADFQFGRPQFHEIPAKGVAEGSLNEGQYEMMMSNGQVKKFTAKDDADAKRIAAGHGAKSVIKLRGGVPAGKVAEQGVAEGLESEDIMANSLGKFAYYAITAKGKDEPQNPYPAGTQSAADFDEGYEAAYDGQTRNLLAAPVKNLVRFYNVRDRLHLLKQGVAEGTSTTWEVSFDYGPHMSKTVSVKAGSEEEAIAKVEKAASKKPEFSRGITINWARPAEQEQLDELSNKTLASYKKKAGEYASAADKAAEISHKGGEHEVGKRWTVRADKRFSGIVNATKKQFDNDAEGINESDLEEGAMDSIKSGIKSVSNRFSKKPASTASVMPNTADANTAKQAVDKAVAVVKTVDDSELPKVVSYGKQQFDSLSASTPASDANTIATPVDTRASIPQTTTTPSAPVTNTTYAQIKQLISKMDKKGKQRLLATINKSLTVAEGNDPWGPQGNFAGDTKVDVGGGTMKKIQAGDDVKYFGEKARVVEVNHARNIARISANGKTLNVRLSDLTQLGQGMAEEKQRLDPKCWKGYKKQGTKMKGDTRVNNCVPVKESAILKGLK